MLPMGCYSSSSCRRRTWQHPRRANAKQAPLIQDKPPGNTLNMPLQKILVISPIQNLQEGLSKLCWLSSPGDKPVVTCDQKGHQHASAKPSSSRIPKSLVQTSQSREEEPTLLPQVPLLQEDQGPLGNPPKPGEAGKTGAVS